MPRSWLQASQNLLVIFEEIGGNPFDISVKTRSARTICAKVSESHYPSLSKFRDSESFGQEFLMSNMTPEINLYCQGRDVISSITFASYGTPQGSCQNFARGSCHAPNSLSVVSQVNSAQPVKFSLFSTSTSAKIVINNEKETKVPCAFSAMELYQIVHIWLHLDFFTNRSTDSRIYNDYIIL